MVSDVLRPLTCCSFWYNMLRIFIISYNRHGRSLQKDSAARKLLLPIIPEREFYTFFVEAFDVASDT